MLIFEIFFKIGVEFVKHSHIVLFAATDLIEVCFHLCGELCVNDFGEFILADLPGYGFARVSKGEKEKWAKFIDAYLTKREPLCGVIQLVDLRHPPSKDDINMYEWLMHMHKDVLVVATKCDKISKGQWLKHIKQVREGLKADKSQQILAFSAETGQGLEELHQWIEARIASVIPEIEE